MKIHLIHDAEAEVCYLAINFYRR